MADYGKLYPALNLGIVEGMKHISSVADYIIPNITEACFLTNNEYKEEYDEEYIKLLVNDLYKLGAKNIILTGVSFEKGKIGAVYYNGKDYISYFSNKIVKSYHGTGDIFSSIIVGNIMNKVDIKDNLKDAVDFIIDCILNTIGDDNHNYGVKFEELLYKRMKRDK